MIIHALRQPDGPVKERLMSVLGKGEDVSPDALADGLAALSELGSVAYARTAEDFHAKAHACLDRLEDCPAMVALRNSRISSWLDFIEHFATVSPIRMAPVD